MKGERRVSPRRGLSLVTAVLALGFASAGCEPPGDDEVQSPIKSDEEVVFFPTYGAVSPDGKEWLLRIHGWIFEPEEDSKLRRVTLSGLRRTLGLEKGEAETELFLRRARLFLTDNERGKRVPIRLGEKVVLRLAPSSGNGHFEELVRLPLPEVDRLVAAQDERTNWLRYVAVVKDTDRRSFVGRVQLVPRVGVSVISDIDDTIKVTNVTDQKALLRNTFLREYQAVPGMAGPYRKMSDDGVQFHYVSNSPWQLYTPLSSFLEKQGFPEGTYHMRPLRLKDRSIVKFLRSPEAHKRATLTSFLETFKQRKFVLIGDCGEKDPEIYGDFGRRYPAQVERILLRDPSGQGTVTPRLRTALRDIPSEKWQVFKDASEVRWP